MLLPGLVRQGCGVGLCRALPPGPSLTEQQGCALRESRLGCHTHPLLCHATPHPHNLLFSTLLQAGVQLCGRLDGRLYVPTRPGPGCAVSVRAVAISFGGCCAGVVWR